MTCPNILKLKKTAEETHSLSSAFLLFSDNTTLIDRSVLIGNYLCIRSLVIRTRCVWSDNVTHIDNNRLYLVLVKSIMRTDIFAGTKNAHNACRFSQKFNISYVSIFMSGIPITLYFVGQNTVYIFYYSVFRKSVIDYWTPCSSV